MQPHMQAVRRRQLQAQVGGEGITSTSKDTLARNGFTTTTLDNNGAAKEESCERTDNEDELLRGEKKEKGEKKKRHVSHRSLRVSEKQMYTYPDTNGAHEIHDVKQKGRRVEQKKTRFSHKRANSEAAFPVSGLTGGEFSKNCHLKIWLRRK